MLGFILLSRRRAESITGPPAKVTTTSPVNGAVNQQLDITITWLRPSQAQSYIVYFVISMYSPASVVTGVPSSIVQISLIDHVLKLNSSPVVVPKLLTESILK